MLRKLSRIAMIQDSKNDCLNPLFPKCLLFKASCTLRK